MMGILAAFVFAGQMVNFPIASGTTGHLLGGTLVAILVGPWAGTVVMAAVILFQALLGDGGITALGPNIFNMGVVGTCMAYFIYRVYVGQALDRPVRVIAASFFAAWVSVPLASAFTSLQLAVSGTVSLSRAFPAMVLTHMLIGIGEALITAAVVAFVVKTRPDLLYGRPAAQDRQVGRLTVAFGLAASLFVATCLSLLPRWWDHPDGLEFVGQEKGFLVEEAVAGEDGSLVTLPAYPLGVRLAVTDGAVVAVHRYDRQSTEVVPGDIIRSVDSQAITDLGGVAAALHFDSAAQTFNIAPGRPIRLVVERAGRQLPLTVPAAVAPPAGSAPALMALLPDYTVPGLSGVISTSAAGAIGTVVMFVVATLVGRVLMRLPITAPRSDAAGS
jgi:cobalt/nickel transport system permease protein